MVVVVAVVAVVVGLRGHSTPPPAPLVSHTIHPTKADDAALESTFLAYKVHNKEMARTDRVTWGQVLQNGPTSPSRLRRA